MPFQSQAVVVFFWLSGFLITYHCLTRKNYNFTAYMIDRFSRIYVLYIPALVISFVIFVLMLGREAPTTYDWIAHLLQLQHTPFGRMIDGIPPVTKIGGNSVLWSIAVEWWLYVFFGVVFFWRNMTAIERGFATVLAVPAVLVVGYFTIREFIGWTWFLGAACAYIFVYMPKIDWKQAIIPLAAVMGGLLWRFDQLSLASAMNMYDHQLMILSGLAMFFLVLACTRLQVSRTAEWLAAKGAFLSYAMYLTHEPVRILIRNYMDTDQLALAWLSIFLCVVFAAICAWLFEDKHLILRRWLKSKLPKQQVSGATKVPA